MTDDPRESMLKRVIDGPPKPKPIRYAIYTRQSVEKLAGSAASDRCTSG